MKRIALLFTVFAASCFAQSSISGCDPNSQSCMWVCPQNQSPIPITSIVNYIAAAEDTIEGYAYLNYFADLLFFLF
jgi:hypothetical protein